MSGGTPSEGSIIETIGSVFLRGASDVIKAAECCLVKAGNGLRIVFYANDKVNVFLSQGSAPVFRWDVPHMRDGRMLGHHINIDPRYWGIRDPHTPLSPAQFEAGVKFAKFCSLVQKISKGLLIISILIDSVRVLNALQKDFKEGTCMNTLAVISSIAGAWGGGYLGAFGGAMIGTAIMPGVGTIIGTIVGSILGSMIGSYVAPIVMTGAADYLQLMTKEGKMSGAAIGAIIGTVISPGLGTAVGAGVGYVYDYFFS